MTVPILYRVALARLEEMAVVEFGTGRVSIGVGLAREVLGKKVRVSRAQQRGVLTEMQAMGLLEYAGPSLLLLRSAEHHAVALPSSSPGSSLACR